MIVEVAVNDGRKLGAIVDSGAGATVLDSAEATLLKLEPAAAVQAKGVGGSVAARYYKGFLVNGLTKNPVELSPVGIPLDPIRRATANDVRMILGYDFLRSFAVEIDYSGSTVTFHADGFSAAQTGIPFRLVQNLPTVAVTIESLDGKVATYDVILDTGSNAGCELDSKVGSMGGLTPKAGSSPIKTLGVGGGTSAIAAEYKSMKVGDVIVDAPLTLTSTVKSGSRQNGRLGSALFAKYRVVIDYPNSKFYLIPR